MNFTKYTEDQLPAYHRYWVSTHFIEYFTIKFLPALWLSIAFSDTDLMLQLCLPYCDHRTLEAHDMYILLWVCMCMGAKLWGGLENNNWVFQVFKLIEHYFLA